MRSRPASGAMDRPRFLQPRAPTRPGTAHSWSEEDLPPSTRLRMVNRLMKQLIDRRKADTPKTEGEVPTNRVSVDIDPQKHVRSTPPTQLNSQIRASPSYRVHSFSFDGFCTRTQRAKCDRRTKGVMDRPTTDQLNGPISSISHTAKGIPNFEKSVHSSVSRLTQAAIDDDLFGQRKSRLTTSQARQWTPFSLSYDPKPTSTHVPSPNLQLFSGHTAAGDTQGSSDSRLAKALSETPSSQRRRVISIPNFSKALGKDSAVVSYSAKAPVADVDYALKEHHHVAFTRHTPTPRLKATLGHQSPVRKPFYSDQMLLFPKYSVVDLEVKSPRIRPTSAPVARRPPPPPNVGAPNAPPPAALLNPVSSVDLLHPRITRTVRIGPPRNVPTHRISLSTDD